MLISEATLPQEDSMETSTSKPVKTLQNEAQRALFVLDASNISGVVHSYSEVMPFLREQSEKAGPLGGSDFIARHPISVMYATKIGELTRVAVIADDACDWSRCYGICQRLAMGEDVPLSEYPSVRNPR
jgi:hypothetical protein